LDDSVPVIVTEMVAWAPWQAFAAEAPSDMTAWKANVAPEPSRPGGEDGRLSEYANFGQLFGSEIETVSVRVTALLPTFARIAWRVQLAPGTRPPTIAVSVVGVSVSTQPTYVALGCTLEGFFHSI